MRLKLSFEVQFLQPDSGSILRSISLKVGCWFHLVDSQTVLGAIQWDSYLYQTLFANRVGEIQKTGPVSDWWWILGKCDTADAMQQGPVFLSKPLA